MATSAVVRPVKVYGNALRKHPRPVRPACGQDALACVGELPTDVTGWGLPLLLPGRPQPKVTALAAYERVAAVQDRCGHRREQDGVLI